MFTNYTDIRDWLENFIPQTYTKKELGLGRIRYLLKLLGNPQDKFKSIHVAGTSGKGSTAFYIAQLLRNCKIQFPNSKLQTNSNSKENNSKNIWDLEFACPTCLRQFEGGRGAWNLKPKVGLHISPHLVDIRERMQIFYASNVHPRGVQGYSAHPGGETRELMPMGRFIRLMNEIKPIVGSMKTSQVGLPSYFEILVAASFLYFAQEKVDIAVVEVGLGGRLDATNVLQPEVSVITNVGLDHTEILGKTIEQIAYEKAGIIKVGEVREVRKVQNVQKVKTKENGVPVITGATGKALEVIKKVAKEKKAPLITKNTLSRAFGKKPDINRYRKLYKKLFNNSFPFVTEGTFLLSCAVVASLGVLPTEAEVSEVFKCPFTGRFEEIEEGVILDGAHNLDKIKVLVRWIEKNCLETFRGKGNEASIVKGLRLTSPKNETGIVTNKRQTIILVVAFKNGKDWQGMVDYLFRNLDVKRCIATRFYSVTDMGPVPDGNRVGLYASVEPEEIKSYIESKSQRVKVESINNSLEAVFEVLNGNVILNESEGSRDSSSSTQNDKPLVLVTGSLYLVGEVRTMWYLPKF